MSKKVALDTNILVYCHSNDEADKQATAMRLLDMYPVVSTQVLSEYINVVKRKLRLPKEEIIDVCLQSVEMCLLQPVTLVTLRHAKRLLARYDFQLFDSIVVAAALEAGCTAFYSEDLHHGLLVENRMEIINPFSPC